MEEVSQDNFRKAILSIDKISAGQIINSYKNKISEIKIIEQIITPVLQEIGKMWSEGKLALAQIYMSGRICEDIIENLLPKNFDSLNTVPIAIAVFEDYHFMGKRIIKSYLNSYGFKIIDYGRVETQELIQNVLRDNVKILLISTLMLNSALHIKELASELNRIKPETKIIVGGAPFIFDKNLYKEIGADDAGYDANDAFNLVKKYLEIKTNT